MNFEETFKDFKWGTENTLFCNLPHDTLKKEYCGGIYDRFFDVEEGDVVLDLGATAGDFIYSILHKKPKHCFVVEPQPEVFPTLKENLMGYPVSFIKVAILDHDLRGSADLKSIRVITFKELVEENNLDNIDFLKLDIEGGEYSIFTLDNVNYLRHIPKIVGEFHLQVDQHDPALLREKFRYFRDKVLPHFPKFEVRSVDGVDIKWDLYNEHFIEYYKHIVFHIDNR